MPALQVRNQSHDLLSHRQRQPAKLEAQDHLTSRCTSFSPIHKLPLSPSPQILELGLRVPGYTHSLNPPNHNLPLLFLLQALHHQHHQDVEQAHRTERNREILGDLCIPLKWWYTSYRRPGRACTEEQPIAR